MTSTSVRVSSTISAELRAGLPVLSFESSAAFDSWLLAEPRTSQGLWLKLAKQASAIVSVAKPDAIDVALCHGWIDGQQNKYDAECWLVRFTPRTRVSRWSQINRRRALELAKAGRMHPAGLGEIDAARADGRWDAAYAPARTATVPPDLAVAFAASPEAAAFFATLKGTNRYAILYRLAAVKTPATRVRRIRGFVAMLERQETIR